jgi:putative FmdB family regulatory protein
MPMYDFYCQDCHTHFSERRSYAQAGDSALCACGSANTRKVLSAVAVMSGGSARPQPASIPLDVASGGGCGCGHCTCGA